MEYKHLTPKNKQQIRDFVADVVDLTLNELEIDTDDDDIIDAHYGEAVHYLVTLLNRRVDTLKVEHDLFQS